MVAARARLRRASSPNSIDAVSNRDFVLDYLGAAATCATHLSRLGAELVLWSSEEFGFVELPDAWSSGSSIMPQKKNPDAAELLRAKAPRIVGHLTALHGVMHALPLTYNKDMQEDKEHLFDTVDTLDLCLPAAERDARAARASTASGWPRRRPTSSSPPPTSPTCSSSAACRSARRTASSPASCARRSSPGAAAGRGRRRRALGDRRRPRSLRQRSWLESKVSEGGTALAARARAARRCARGALLG